MIKKILLYTLLTAVLTGNGVLLYKYSKAQKKLTALRNVVQKPPYLILTNQVFIAQPNGLVLFNVPSEHWSNIMSHNIKFLRTNDVLFGD